MRCTNLSMGGAFLEGQQLPLGTQLYVTIDLGGLGLLHMDVQVRHHANAPRGMGVQFLRFEQQQLDLITRAVEVQTS